MQGLTLIGIRSTTSKRSTIRRDGRRSDGRQNLPQVSNGLVGKAMCMPEMAERLLQFSFCCFPHASPISPEGPGKQKMAPKGHPKSLFLLRKPGAGDANRTRDPNLGKVMLYP